MDRFFRVRVWAAPLCALLLTTVANGQTVTIKEISPTHSNIGGAVNSSGGRVNHLARASDTVFYAASEFGGLFKSTDTGRTWTRLDRHLPTRMFDVKASPADPNVVIATSLYDGRINSLAGINVSSDGGASWTKPASATPPASLCSGSIVLQEPAAFGIAFDPQNGNNVFVGTNCGLAKSTNRGVSWTFINPGPGSLATNVFGVIVHHGGIIDTCGSNGHRRSIDGGATWNGPQAGGTALQAGPCTLAVSPDESSVLFATVSTLIFESDNGGGSWNTQFVNPAPQGRVTFVATNNRVGRNFDLWFGDVLLFRAACKTPTTPSTAARCPASSSWVRVDTGAHRDMGEVVFTRPPDSSACSQNCANTEASCKTDCDEELKSCMANAGKPGEPTKAQCSTNASQCRAKCASDRAACDARCQEGCPVLVSSDGGAYFNSLTQSPGCQTPRWTQPTVTTRALWLWSLAGADIPNSRTGEAVFMGAQDNGVFRALNAGTAVPDWINPDGFDVSDVVPDNSTQIAFSICCLSAPRNQVHLKNIAMTSGGKISNHPPGTIAFGQFPDVIVRFGARRYAIATSNGIFVTQNINANPITWTSLGTNAPIFAGGLWVTPSQTNPTFYALTSNQATLVRFIGTSATGTWQNVALPPGFASVGAFGVDPRNPNRLFISAFNNTTVKMFRSSDGGVNWTGDTVLDGLMNGGGAFRTKVQTLNYFQPTLALFDPNNPGTLLAGAADAGMFLSLDNGASWKTVTNNSGDAANPIIPRPFWAYFDRECGENNIYVGTQGRGVWRLSYRDPEGITVSECQSRCESTFGECQSECDQLRKDCLAETGPNKPTPAQCATARTDCKNNCTRTRDSCRLKCVDCPQ